MSHPREKGLKANLIQLGGDLTKVAIKSGFTVALANQIIGSSATFNNTFRELAFFGGAGVANYLFGDLNNLYRPVGMKENNLINITESILVGTNPIAIVEILNSFLPVETKAIALVGLALINATMMYTSRRLSDL